MPSSTCVKWTELCQRTAREGKRLICLTLTIHPGAFVGGVDWNVDMKLLLKLNQNWIGRAWNLPVQGTCRTWNWNMHLICICMPKYAQNMPLHRLQHSKYANYMHKIYTHIYAQNMHIICINMHHVWSKCAVNMHKICIKYAIINVANMQNICTKYAYICTKNAFKMHKYVYTIRA